MDVVEVNDDLEKILTLSKSDIEKLLSEMTLAEIEDLFKKIDEVDKDDYR